MHWTVMENRLLTISQIIERLRGMGNGEDRSDRAYYYRTLGEHRCSLTDPYPSLVTNKMVVTSSFPIYDENDNLLCIICVDIALENILRWYTQVLSILLRVK